VTAAVEAPPVLTDEQLRALTEPERRQLAKRLAALNGARRAYPRGLVWALAAVVACLALGGWMLVMAGSLPARYVTGHWDTAWLGFDAILLVSFAVTGWTAWRAHPARPVAAMATAVLLLCDAWFDVTTAAAPDLPGSVLSAALVELPLAGLVAWSAYRQLRRP
jgi:hypothetical protein